MKNTVIKLLFSALLAVISTTPAYANPWWRWPAKTPVKTVQLALPAINGTVVSVTVPAKSPTVRHYSGPGRQPGSPADLRDEERIAAELERH
jgi:hypothetical protein